MTYVALGGTISGFATVEHETAHWIAANLVLGALALRTHIERHYKATLVAIADRRMVEQHARTDALTGLQNRRSFYASFEEMPLSIRSNRCFIAIDLDRFKTVNDTHGHAAGDTVLKAVASRLSIACGPSSVVARMGGDEFSAIVSGDLKSGHAIVEAIRHALTAPIRVGVDHVVIGASIGVVAISGTSTLDQLDALADDLMYAAKRATKKRFITLSSA